MRNTQILRSVEIDWSKVAPDSYFNQIQALRNTDHIDFDYPVTLFAGENGSGKSTFLEAIAVAYGFNPEGGTSGEFLQRCVSGRRVQPRTKWEPAAFS